MRLARHRAAQRHAPGIDATRVEAGSQPPRRLAVGSIQLRVAVLQEQARVGHAMQHRRDRIPHAIVELRQALEHAERRVAVDERGRWRDRRTAVGQLERQVAGLEMVEPLRVLDLGSRRARPAIGEQPVDAGTSGGRRIVRVGHLHRRDAIAEQRQAVEWKVPGQIDDDVEVVGAHPPGERGVAQTAGCPPVLAERLVASRELVGDRAGVVQEDLDGRSIVRPKERMEEVPERRRSVFAGEVADAQSTVAPRQPPRGQPRTMRSWRRPRAMPRGCWRRPPRDRRAG